MNSKTTFLIIFYSLFVFTTEAQNSCKVLTENIAGKYTGECKKGLAHGTGKAQGIDTYEGEFKKGKPNGFGTMYYKNGSKYIGEWKRGVKHGTGKLEKRNSERDSISLTEGVWSKGEYLGKEKGKKTREYKVVNKQGVQRYTIRKISDEFNRVTIVINNNGSPVRSPNNIYVSSGTQFSTYGRTGFQNIESYPFTCEMRYNMPTKLGASTYPVEFGFEIFKEGDWLVEIFH